MSVFTLPSGQDHHFRERAFKRSFLVSIAVHAVIIVAAGSMTLFRMSGTNYAPSYTVDLVSLPPAAPEKKAPARAEKRAQPVPDRTVTKAPEQTPPVEAPSDLKPAGGDEAARSERRRRIEELEMEARRLYETFTAEEQVRDGGEARPERTSAPPSPVEGTGVSGAETASDIRFRAYYDRIWSRIRSSWVVPEGVTSTATLLTVVGIRVATDGEIEQFWIEQRSGNEYYDQSALRAIRKANPLPPLPDGLGDTALEVGIRFKYPE